MVEHKETKGNVDWRKH